MDEFEADVQLPLLVRIFLRSIHFSCIENIRSPNFNTRERSISKSSASNFVLLLSVTSYSSAVVIYFGSVDNFSICQKSEFGQ